MCVDSKSQTTKPDPFSGRPIYTIDFNKTAKQGQALGIGVWLAGKKGQALGIGVDAER